MLFKEVTNGLYIYNVSDNLKNNCDKHILKHNYHHSLVSTVKPNESKFTNCKLKISKMALDLHKNWEGQNMITS